jgi:hypothetical protein
MKVSDLFDRILPRAAKLGSLEAGLTYLQAVNKVADIFFSRLHQRRSSIAREPFSGLEVTQEFVYLPSDFRGFADKQKLKDSNDNLSNLDEMPYGWSGVTGSEPPVYFRLVGPFKLQFTAPPEDDAYTETYTLEGYYYAHPGDLAIIDHLPWEELYDQEFEEGVMIALTLGTTDEMVVRRIGDLVEQQENNRVVAPRRNKVWL